MFDQWKNTNKAIDWFTTIHTTKYKRLLSFNYRAHIKHINRLC